MNPVTAAIALGSNLASDLGDRRSHIAHAFEALGAIPGTKLLRKSAVIETAPVGPVEQGPYLNAAALVETTLPPRDLLAALFVIERERGRDRTHEQRWGPRTLDLDLLTYGDAIIQEPGLHVPHPRLAERLFVLEPLAQIAPELIPPGQSMPVARLLELQKTATGEGRRV